MPETASQNPSEPPRPSEARKSEITQKDRDLPTLLLLLLLAVFVFAMFLFDPRTSVMGDDSRQSLREGAATAYSVAETEIPKATARMADFFRYVFAYPGVSVRPEPEFFAPQVSDFRPQALPEVPSVPAIPSESASGTNVPLADFVSSADEGAAPPVTLRLGEYSFEFS